MHQHLIAIAIALSLTLSDQAPATNTEERHEKLNPSEHAHDTVQEAYSSLTMGLDLAIRCQDVHASHLAEYKRFAIEAGAEFRRYIRAKGFTRDGNESREYQRLLKESSYRFMRTMACDGHADKKIREGFELSEGFARLVQDNMP